MIDHNLQVRIYNITYINFYWGDGGHYTEKKIWTDSI